MKERLTGAIILVALIVLLVPELLSGPPRAKRPSARAANAPSATAQPPVHSYTLPLGANLARSNAVIKLPAKPAPVVVVQPKVAAPPHPAVKPTTTRPDRPRPARAAPRPKPPAQARPRAKNRPAAHTGRRWVVQLGAFAIHADALRLTRRVRRDGIPVRVTAMRIHGRRLWRVATTSVRGRAAGLALAHRLRRLGVRGELLRQ